MKKWKRFLITLLISLLLAVNASAEEAAAMTTVKEGATYWECSQMMGASNVVNDDNPYINKNREVVINGWAVLRDNQILDYVYEDGATVDIELPNIPDGAYLMIHIRGVLPDEYTRLGWVRVSDCETVIANQMTEEQTSEEQTSEEFVENAKECLKEGTKKDQEAGLQTVIVFDCSGSMASYMQRIYEEVEEIKEEKSPIYLYAFGTYVSEAMKEITEEKWNKILCYEYGITSNIVGSILKSTEENPKSHVYLLTDMNDTQETTWKNSDFDGKITVIRYGYEPSYFYESITEHFYKATIELIEAR